jgi:hypothetical protein
MNIQISAVNERPDHIAETLRSIADAIMDPNNSIEDLTGTHGTDCMVFVTAWRNDSPAPDPQHHSSLIIPLS